MSVLIASWFFLSLYFLSFFWGRENLKGPKKWRQHTGTNHPLPFFFVVVD
jgi:hypothetical protein